MKAYLDTNIVFGFFKRFLESRFLHKPFKMPYKMKVLSMAGEAYVSEFVLSEVAIEIKKWCVENKMQLSAEEIESILEEFIKRFNIKLIRHIELKDLVTFVITGIDLKDSVHLEISKSKDMVLVTDDKKLYEASKYFYGKVLSFKEFRKIVNGPTQN